MSLYCARLRKAANIGCNYNDVDKMIRDQIVEYCLSDDLRRKLMEEGNGLSLARTLQLAATQEAVDIRFREMSNRPLLNRVSSGSGGNRGPFRNQSSGSSPVGGYGNKTANRCESCGRHKSHVKCPAQGKQCYKCSGYNHFKHMCRNKSVNQLGNSSSDFVEGSNIEFDGGLPHVSSSPDSHAFTIHTVSKLDNLDRVDVCVGGCSIKAIVDTGADCNVISMVEWKRLKSEGVKVSRSQKGTTSQVFSYASQRPLTVVGEFWTDITFQDHETVSSMKFIVVEGNAEALLGNVVCKRLGIVKICVNQVRPSSVDALKRKYHSLFSDKLGKVEQEIQLSIDESVKPVAQPYRRVPFAMREKLERHLDELVSMDIIEKVEGPTTWSSGVVIVPKPDGSIRLCVDMRQANKAIIRHHFPVPTIDELMLDMNGSTVFSKIDMRMGFHQFVLSEDSRDITTFTTHAGLYRYKRLSFGICSAPEIYQRKISDMIGGIPGVVNLADDIVVHGRTQVEHDNRLEETLARLSRLNMTLNSKKCQFSVEKIDFLGHRISSSGVDPGADKVQAMQDATVPKTVGEMKSFLGLASYCSKFIPDFSSRTDRLRRITLGEDSNSKIVLESKELAAFKDLKNALSDKSTLGFFKLDAKTILYTDASPVGLGAVLIQDDGSAKRVISYASRALSPVEQRYCQTEKEALAIVWGSERFHHYLFGVRYTLLTDHEPLEVIYGNSQKKTSARIERWVLRLQSYDFDVKYIKGKFNIADCLSRLVSAAKSRCVSSEDAELYVRSIVINGVVDLKAITPKDVEVASDNDSELCYIRKAIATGSFEHVPVDISKQYKPIFGELCVLGRLVLRGDRIVIPRDLRQRIIELSHEGHLGIVSTKKNLRARVWWPGLDGQVEKYVKSCQGCQLVGQPHSREPIRVTELPNGPWEDLACDLLGPLENGDHVLVLVDYYSRYYEVSYMRSIVASKIIEVLMKMFEMHGLPLSLKTDNAPQFISSDFREFSECMGFKHYLVTPRWAQANGEVERQNRSLMKRIQIAIAERKCYKTEVQRYLNAYRNTPHSITGKAPSEMLFGRKLRVKIPSVGQVYDDIETRDKDSELKHQMVEAKNCRRSDHEIVVGDLVLVMRDNKSKCQTPFHHEPYKVREVSGPQLVLESGDGRIFKRNISRVRRYLLPSSVDVSGGADSDDFRTPNTPSYSGDSDRSVTANVPFTGLQGEYNQSPEGISSYDETRLPSADTPSRTIPLSPATQTNSQQRDVHNSNSSQAEQATPTAPNTRPVRKRFQPKRLGDYHLY